MFKFKTSNTLVRSSATHPTTLPLLIALYHLFVIFKRQDSHE